MVLFGKKSGLDFVVSVVWGTSSPNPGNGW